MTGGVVITNFFVYFVLVGFQLRTMWEDLGEFSQFSCYNIILGSALHVCV